MQLDFDSRPPVQPPLVLERSIPAKPFSPLATVVFALSAIVFILFTMRPYWSGNRLAVLFYPVDTVIWVTTVNMLLHDGASQLPPGWKRVFEAVEGTDHLPRECAEILRETMDHVSTKDARGAARLRAQLIVLLCETGARADAFALLPGMDDPDAADFRRAVRAVYDTNTLSDISGSLDIERPFDYLDSSWAAWHFQSRWYRHIGVTSHQARIDDWILGEERRNVLIVLTVSAIGFGATILGLGLLFWMFRPPTRRLFGGRFPQTFSFGEGIGIFVRAELCGTLLSYLCSQNPLTRIPSMAYGLLLAAPLVVIVAHRHWSRGNGSFAEFVGLPISSRGWLILSVSALCVFGVDWFCAFFINTTASALGIEGHWTEGFDEVLIYEAWPIRFVPLLNGVVLIPIYEELAYRGLLFPALRVRLGVLPAALISSIVFASMHFYSLPGFLSVTIFGFVSALVFQRTRSLVPCIVGHIFANLLYYATMLGLFS
jgi:membrane protease YdiL (CAAX protease family)